MRFFRIFFLVTFSLLWFRAPSVPNQDLKNWFEGQEKKIRVLATTKMCASLIEEIGKEHVHVLTLIAEDLDPHSYQVVKGDSDKFRRADVVFANGLHLEHTHSLHKLLDDDKTIFLGDVVLNSEPDSFHSFDGTIDPHFWMDVHLFSKTVPTIKEALIQLDPEHADFFEKNALDLEKKLDILDRKIYSILQSIPEKNRYLVTSHDAFNYFSKRYLRGENDRLDRFMAPEGVSPDGQIGPIDIQNIIDHVLKCRVAVVFAESNISHDSLNKILESCKQQGIELRLAKEELFADSMGSGSYCDMMEHNLKVIYQELYADSIGQEDDKK